MRLLQCIFGFVGVLMAQVVLSAPLKVKVTSGNFSPTPIAIMPFYETSDNTDNTDVRAASKDMREIIINNLLSSGLFENVSQDAFLETVENAIPQPDFRKWSAIRTDVLVTTQVTITPDSKYEFLVTTWDINRSISLFSRKYTIGTLKSYRLLSHMISDAIYSRITGESPYFNSEIIFVDETKDKDGNIVKRLAIMDQDGANLQYITDGSQIVTNPRFSPDGKYLTYLSYIGDTVKNRSAGIYLRNRETSKQTFLTTKNNTSYAARFSPDSKKMIFSYMIGGSSDIWVMWIGKGTAKFDRLTNTKEIDTTPFYSPDSEKIVFVSDRSGSAQLYTMNADGTGQTRISYGDGAYTTPVWSPRGDIIAFTKQMGQLFHIGVMNPDGSGERLLTKSYLDEGPTFSPNGRVIMFFRQDEGTDNVYLMSVDITGRNLRKINTPNGASDPHWSVIRKR